MTFDEMNPHGYALAFALLSDPDRLPFPVRAAGLAFLRRFEPHPADVREAALKAHTTGHLRGGRLTAEGERDALEALRGVGLSPRPGSGPL